MVLDCEQTSKSSKSAKISQKLETFADILFFLRLRLQLHKAILEPFNDGQLENGAAPSSIGDRLCPWCAPVMLIHARS